MFCYTHNGYLVKIRDVRLFYSLEEMYILYRQPYAAVNTKLRGP
jgi:hypothetical protein